MNGSLGLGYLAAPFKAALRVGWAATQHQTAPDEAETAGFAVLGADVGYAFGFGEVTLAVDNLADEGYRLHGSSIAAPGFDARAALDIWY